MTPAAARTLLIVDDDRVLAESVQALLQHQFPKLNVLRADSAENANTILGSQKVDVVLSDYQIADMDGIEFLRKAREGNDSMRCILMTGYPAVGLAVRAQKEAHIDAMAVKPFDAKQIVGLVGAVLKSESHEFRYSAPA